MLLLTEDAVLICKHALGVVGIVAGQQLVTVAGRKLLIDNDPESRPITGCPNVGATIKPCVSTLPVQVGYSDLMRINGRRVCLDTVTGITDGTPPGTVKYNVKAAGQGFVRERT